MICSPFNLSPFYQHRRIDSVVIVVFSAKNIAICYKVTIFIVEVFIASKSVSNLKAVVIIEINLFSLNGLCAF